MMRYHLPPPDEPPGRDIGAVRAIRAPDAIPREHREADAPLGDGRLIRTLTMGVAEANAHLARWESEAAGHAIPAPPGVIARERSVTDRVEPGAQRRQRLALVSAGDTVTATHWSVPEPPRPADERAWARVIARACDPETRGGWTA